MLQYGPTGLTQCLRESERANSALVDEVEQAMSGLRELGDA